MDSLHCLTFQKRKLLIVNHRPTTNKWKKIILLNDLWQIFLLRTYVILRIDEDINEHWYIIRCPAYYESGYDRNRYSQRLHFGPMNQFLSIAQCTTFTIIRYSIQLEDFFTAYLIILWNEKKKNERNTKKFLSLYLDNSEWRLKD